MGLWSYFVANWGLMTQHPTPFIALVLLAFGAGWLVAAVLYRQRLGTQRERVIHWEKRLDLARSRQPIA